MTAKILNGKIIAKKIIKKISVYVRNRIKVGKRVPGLAIISIGENFAQDLYNNSNCKACKSAGFILLIYNLPENIKEKSVVKIIKELNDNRNIDGILVQSPLPYNIDAVKIFESISPYKDVDGFHPYNIGRLYYCKSVFRSCTSYGIMTLLSSYNINISGLNTVIVGSSYTVGRPIGLELMLSGCTVTITNNLTKNLKEYVSKADLLIVAVGKAEFIPGDWIKIGAIVIDVGINYLNNKIVGDIEYNKSAVKASYITPVPGGVGPMTTATLIQNTLYACENYHDRSLLIKFY